jgi:hypothetical protein
MEETMNQYRQFVKQLLARYESLSTEHSKVELLFDDVRNSYLAVRLGWSRGTRIYVCLVHIDIRGDLITVQCNNTEDEVATELVKMGVPADRIRLAFLPPAAQLFSVTREHSTSDANAIVAGNH